MSLITNSVFTETEKGYLEFVLRWDFPEKAHAVQALNRMKESDLSRDVTPHYWILEFRPEGTELVYGPMEVFLSLEVGPVPTVFLLYGRNGLPFELEIFNADGSLMDPENILKGPVRVCLPE